MHPEPVIKPSIPPAYFSSSEQDFNTTALVEILSSVPNSPLTPGGILQNFTPTFPNATMSNNIGNLTPANLRFHQQQSLQQVKLQNTALNLASNEMQAYSHVSPRSMNANTSGYLSQLSQMGSLNISGCSHSSEQLNGNLMSNFQTQENRGVMSASTSNITMHLNDNEIHTFEMDNQLLTPTPVYHPVSNEKNASDIFKTTFIFQQSRAMELDRKRIDGLRAMDRFDLNREQVRTPTDAWSKFSLSKTSPFALESSTVGVSQWAQREKLNFDKVSTTSLIDSIPWNDRIPLSQFKDIHSLLSHLKLEHYISKYFFSALFCLCLLRFYFFKKIIQMVDLWSLNFLAILVDYF